MITLDCETKSHANLKQIGAWNYSLHPTTDVICVSYAINGRISTWLPGCSLPEKLHIAIAKFNVTVEAHNVAFEEAIWNNILVPRYGFDPIHPKQWRDTMAVACYLALPAALDKLSFALGGPGKDSEGARLISKYSKLHLKTAKETIPLEELNKFCQYCEDDVDLESGLSLFLGDLPPRELEIFLLDRKINRRGIYLDLEGIAAASEIVDKRSTKLSARFKELTGVNPTQNAKVLEWLQKHGADFIDIQKETIEDYLEETKPTGDIETVLKIKLEVGKTSTRKLDAMARHAGPDGRARNQTRYHGATTGRSTGMGFQPLNLVRGYEDIQPEILVGAILHKDPEFLDLMFGDAMTAVSKASRHWIKAEPGNRLLVADFSSIEAVILACLAGEGWKIEALRDGDLLYERMGERIHKLTPGSVTKKTHPNERFDGKVAELAFGYQGALGAWRKFDTSDRHTDMKVIEICKAWRAEHPAIVNVWGGYEHIFKSVLRGEGSCEYRGIVCRREDEWVSLQLLNGKKLWYFNPEFRMKMPPFHKPKENELCAAGVCDCTPRPSITYMSMKSGKWVRVHTYGGKITENVVQAISREILEDKKLKLDNLGYDIILSVYDEVVCEMPIGKGSVKEFAEVMQERSSFYSDWPIRVEAWEGERYKK